MPFQAPRLVKHLKTGLHEQESELSNPVKNLFLFTICYWRGYNKNRIRENTGRHLFASQGQWPTYR